MPRLSTEVKEQIRKLSQTDLQNIVLKMAAREKSVYDFILMNYLDKEGGEQELFEQAKADLDMLFRKGYKGFSTQLQLANMLNACTKRINEFTKVSPNKLMEADLLLYVLEVPFSLSTNLFGTCFTTYDTRVAIMLRRLINIVTGKIHEDFRINYTGKINGYLQILHRTSRHIDTVYSLPQAV
jgi:hypothetical protein